MDPGILERGFIYIKGLGGGGGGGVCFADLISFFLRGGGGVVTLDYLVSCNFRENFIFANSVKSIFVTE